MSSKTPGPRPLISAGRDSSSSVDGDRSRSRSRSAHKSIDENLLVSLNESCPPIANASGANLSLERSMSVGNYAGRTSLLQGLKLTPSKSVNHEEDLMSVTTNPRARLQSLGKGHEKIKVRYTTKQLLSIFKGLGRFQSPLEHHELYNIDLDRSEFILREKLMQTKPDVVLEHLKTETALPLTSNARIQGKIYSRVTQQLNSINSNVRPY